MGIFEELTKKITFYEGKEMQVVYDDIFNMFPGCYVAYDIEGRISSGKAVVNIKAVCPANEPRTAVFVFLKRKFRGAAFDFMAVEHNLPVSWINDELVYKPGREMNIAVLRRNIGCISMLNRLDETVKRHNITMIYVETLQGMKVRGFSLVPLDTISHMMEGMSCPEGPYKFMSLMELKDKYDTEGETPDTEEACPIDFSVSEEEPELNDHGQLVNSIKSFVKNVPFSTFVKDIEEYVIGQGEELGKAAMSVYFYLSSVARGDVHKHNFLIAAPSGCGKTQFFRAVKQVLNDKYEIEIPVVQIDITSITEEGYKGNDTKEIYKAFLDENPDCGGIAIVFFDEIDKRMMPSFTSQGTNVNAAVQNQLLTMIEGIESNLEIGRRHYYVDTNMTMFIGMGAFQTVRDMKTQDDKKSLGFTAAPRKEENDIIYDDITKNDMIELGCRYEFLGRFEQVVNFHKLSKEAVCQIIDGYIKDISPVATWKISITDAAKEEFFQFANGPYGCRTLASEIFQTLQSHFYKHMLEGNDRDTMTFTIQGIGKVRARKNKSKIKTQEVMIPDTDCC